MIYRKDKFIEIKNTEIHYSEWGEKNSKTVICLHGLSRVGRDFDVISKKLSKKYKVLCPDMPGRGLSEWSKNPTKDYSITGIKNTVIEFCNSLNIDNIRLIGTSMGGIIGIILSGGEFSDRITRLVVNDVSPGPKDNIKLEDEIKRILEYLSQKPEFETLTELESYYRSIYEGFSKMEDREWKRFTISSSTRKSDGKFTPCYDTKILKPILKGNISSYWEEWNSISSDIFIIRGENSDILPRQLFEEMISSQPESKSLEVPNCGHAPALNVEDQINPIREFLKE